MQIERYICREVLFITEYITPHYISTNEIMNKQMQLKVTDNYC